MLNIIKKINKNHINTILSIIKRINEYCPSLEDKIRFWISIANIKIPKRATIMLVDTPNVIGICLKKNNIALSITIYPKIFVYKKRILITDARWVENIKEFTLDEIDKINKYIVNQFKIKTDIK